MPKKSALSEFREKHQGELETNLTTAKSIRDDPDASDKDKIEAIKTISRLLGALAPERVAPKSGGTDESKVVLTAEEMADLDKRIADDLKI